jgi:hypothetical protein
MTFETTSRQDDHIIPLEVYVLWASQYRSDQHHYYGIVSIPKNKSKYFFPKVSGSRFPVQGSTFKVMRTLSHSSSEIGIAQP